MLTTNDVLLAEKIKEILKWKTATKKKENVLATDINKYFGQQNILNVYASEKTNG